MKYLNLIILLLLIFHPIVMKSQANDFEENLLKYKTKLSHNSNISDCIFHKEFYSKGNLKSLGVYAKLKSDSLERFFKMGEYFEFYKNGNLKYTYRIDSSTLMMADTFKVYTQNGKIKKLDVFHYINESDKDTISINPLINGKEATEIIYAYIDKGFYWKIDKTLDSNTTVYRKIPKFVYKQLYFSGIINQSFEGVYNNFMEGYTLLGDLTHYKKDGSVLSITPQIERVKLNEFNIQFSGNNSNNIMQTVTAKINSFEQNPILKIDMPWGYYTKNDISKDCFIYGFDNLFVLTKETDDIMALTATEIDSYYQNNQIYSKSCIGGNCYFIEKLQNGKIELFYKTSILGDYGNIYYLKEKQSSTCYIVLTEEISMYIKDQFKEGFSIENMLITKSIILNEASLINGLLELPNFKDFLIKRDALGLYSVSDLNKLIKAYNDNNR